MRKWWFVILLVFGWWRPTMVAAAGADFTVSPQLPPTQIDGDQGYFNVLLSPGKQQTLSVVIANQSAKAQRLTAELTDAYTQANGQVGYAPKRVAEPGQSVWLTAIGSAPVTLTLQPHQARTVSFQVTPPASGFAGQVLGAVYVRAATTTPATASSGFALVNRFAMVVAVQIQTAKALVAPQVVLATAKPAQQAVALRLRNVAPRLFGHLTLTSRLTAVGSGQTIATATTKGLAMAPHSHLDYQLPVKQALAPGRYRVAVTAQAGNYRWQLAQTVTVSAAEAKRLVPPTTPQRLAVWWVIGGGTAILGVAGEGYWWYRRRRATRKKGV
jgi:hypothetical protein